MEIQYLCRIKDKGRRFGIVAGIEDEAWRLNIITGLETEGGGYNIVADMPDHSTFQVANDDLSHCPPFQLIFPNFLDVSYQFIDLDPYCHCVPTYAASDC